MRNATRRTDSRWSFCDNRRVWTAVAIVLAAALLIVTPNVYAQSAAETGRPDALPEIPEIVVTGGTMPAVEGGPSDWGRPGGGLPTLPSPDFVETSLPTAAEVPLGARNELGNDHSDASDGPDRRQHEERTHARRSAAHLAAGFDRIDEARRLLDRVRELKDSPRVTARQRELPDVEVDEPFGFDQA